MKFLARDANFCVPTKTIASRKWLFFMRLSCLLITTLLVSTNLLTASPGKAQSPEDTRVTVSLKGESLKSAIRQIEKQTPFRFAYVESQIDVYGKLYLPGRSRTLPNTLDLLLANTGLKFLVNKTTIVIVENDSSGKKASRDKGWDPVQGGGSVAGMPDPILIRGRVTDNKSFPLANVSIVIKGSAKGVTTDGNGEFSIEIPDDKAVILVVTYIGFQTLEVTPGKKKWYDIQLMPVSVKLDEVVVVGYGTQKKVSVTGAIATISSKEVKQAPVSNLTNSLAGLLPGVTAINTVGRPGAGSSINIRGISTFGDNSVLTLVDGIVRPFDEIDPNEVESVTVLKDAAAAAVYGARAANGVILVTTRRGHIGKPRVSLNSYVGTQQPTRYPKIMNGYQYATNFNQALLNVGKSTYFTNQQLANLQSGKVGTNWYDLTFKNNPIQYQENISVDGGSENIRYFFSGGYTNQAGMYDNIDYRRYNFRSNVDAKITRLLTVSVDLDGRVSQNYSPSFTDATIFGHVLRENPTINAFNPDGTPNNTTGEHPYEEVHNSGYIHNTDKNIFATLNFRQELPFITKGLSASAKFDYNSDNQFIKEWDLPYSMYSEDSLGNITSTKIVGKNIPQTELWETYQQSNAYTIDLSLNYQRSFGKHDFGALFLYEQAAGNYDTLTAYRTFFPSNAIDQLFAGGDSSKTNSGSAGQTGRLSYVGRLNYAYDGKYLLEGSFRYDGSSIFAPGHRFGFFPAVSAGWRISEEHFIKDNPRLDFINNLKIRASYGVLGNDRVAPFQWTDSYTTQNTPVAVFNNSNLENTVAYGVYPNPNITWERAKTTDIGLEGLLFNGKLGFEMDYFYKRTSDILQPPTLLVPGTFGRTLPAVNYAVADNQGYEVVLSHSNHIGQFKFSFRGNVAYAINKGIVLADGAGTALWQRRVGKTLSYRTGLKTAGIFQSQQEVVSSPYQGPTVGAGDLKYKDLNGDGVVDYTNDVTQISSDNTMPKYTFGLLINAEWKGLDFSVLFQGAARVNYMMSGTARNMFYNGGNSNNFAYLGDAWTPQNPHAAFPRPWVDANTNNNYDSDFWLKKTDYVRLKSLQLGYTFPHLRAKGIDRLRIYVSGYNLLTVSKFKYFDPEVSATNGSYYPQQRNFNAGVNLTF
jgi:TonB-linked SusC/RagA family outer membrane protein